MWLGGRDGWREEGWVEVCCEMEGEKERRGSRQEVKGWSEGKVRMETVTDGRRCNGSSGRVGRIGYEECDFEER